jgi:hypothetical protein
MSLDWRLRIGVVLMLLIHNSATAQEFSVPAAEALPLLETYRSSIHRLRQEMDGRFDHGAATATLKSAFLDRGASEKVIEFYANAWAGAGLAFDYVGARKPVYDYHHDALVESIDYVKSTGSARGDALTAIRQGMQEWGDYEESLRTLLNERVELFVKSALNTDRSWNIDGMACAGNGACEQAKAVAGAEVSNEGKKLDKRLGDNRAAIAHLNAKFFAPITGEAGPECTRMSVSYQPSVIPYGSTGKAIVTYSPLNCQRPKGAIDFNFTEGGANFLLIAGDVRAFRNTSSNAIIKAEHGALAASASVSSSALPECTKIRLDYEPNNIRLDGKARPVVNFLPEDCVKPRANAHFSSQNPRIAWVERSDEGIVRGISEGLATIDLRIENLTTQAITTIVNTGPDCSQISMHYPVQPLRISYSTPVFEPENTSPTLRYSPDQCRRPAGRPTFSMITPSLAKVDARTGQVQASSYTKDVGTARVGVQHGDLSAVASIEIASIPVCDWLLLDYAPKELQVHYFARPKLNYSYRGAYSNTCNRPQGSPEFTLELSTTANNHPVVELGEDGSVRGATPGYGTIKVTHAGLEAISGIKVLDAQEGPECNAFTAKFEPGPSVRLSARVVLVERYYLEDAPSAPCRKPNSPLIVESVAGRGNIEFTSAARAIGRSPGEVTVNFRRGTLSASADIFFVPDKYFECTSMVLTYVPHKLGWNPQNGRRERAVPKLEYSPPGCAVSGTTSWESSSKNFRVDPYTGIVTVHAAPEIHTYSYTVVTVTQRNLTAQARIELAD